MVDGTTTDLQMCSAGQKHHLFLLIGQRNIWRDSNRFWKNCPHRDSCSCVQVLHKTHIFHEYHELYSWRKNCHVDFSFPCMTIVGKLKISPHVEKFQMSPHDRCGGIWNSPHVEKFSIFPQLSYMESWNFSTWQFSPLIILVPNVRSAHKLPSS